MNSETKTDKGTRKFQVNGPASWGAAMSRAAGRGQREALGTRSAVAFAVAHEAQWLRWAAEAEVDTLGQTAKEREAQDKADAKPKAVKPKAVKAHKAKAVKALKAETVEAKS